MMIINIEKNEDDISLKMIINGKTSNSTVTDELLDIREKRWHKILPNAFKSFIKNHNLNISND